MSARRPSRSHIKHSRIGPVPPPRRDAAPVSTSRHVFTTAARSSPSGPSPAGATVPPQPGQVLYLHGGAFVEGIFCWHWYFIARMVERLGMTFTVPLYPLAPEHDAATTGAFTLDLYRELLGERPGPWWSWAIPPEAASPWR